MFGEMLAKGRTKSPEQATEYAEIIWRESVRLGRLIDNVLDFAKIERGMGVYEFAEARPRRGRRCARSSCREPPAPDRRHDARVRASTTDLPLIRLDANAFTLAVLNLIDNAIKYAADGKKIELTLRRAGDRVVLAVRDFGPGIAAEEQARIFERFYRAKAMRLKPIRGSGIGLALVQHIARAHGGDVTVESEPGKGATFQHLAADPDKNGRHAMSRRAGGTQARSSSSRTSPTSCAGCATRSSSRASRSMRAAPAPRGSRAAMDWAPDCVLLDLMLPDDNGYRVCETLRQRDETVPIIILTAKAQETDKIRGLDAGADDYVTKPFSVAELIARINAIFRRQARMSSHSDETFTIGTWTINARKHTMTQGPHHASA